jgi:hypothetical protein
MKEKPAQLFTADMSSNIYPSNEPPTEEEHEELGERYKVVSNRISDVLLEQLE